MHQMAVRVSKNKKDEIYTYMNFRLQNYELQLGKNV